MFPLARTKNLTIREFAHETVVYDLDTNKVHCLNPKSALIWKHCDGHTSLEQLARLVWEKENCTYPEALVHLALEQLSRRNLLQTANPLPAASRPSRREALRKLVAAAVAIPVIMSLTAPKAQAAATVVAGCLLDSQCPSNNPCQSGRCESTLDTTNTNQHVRTGKCVFTALNGQQPGCSGNFSCQNGTCVPFETT